MMQKSKFNKFHHLWIQQVLIYTKWITTLQVKENSITNYNTINVVLLKHNIIYEGLIHTVYWLPLKLCMSLQTVTTTIIYYNYLIWNDAMVTRHVSVKSLVNVKAMDVNQPENSRTVMWLLCHWQGKVSQPMKNNVSDGNEHFQPMKYRNTHTLLRWMKHWEHQYKRFNVKKRR